MNKIKVILFILDSIKVLIDIYNRQDYKDIKIKRITITIIKYISSNSRYLNSIII